MDGDQFVSEVMTGARAMSTDQAAWVRRAQHGDIAAFEALFRQHYGWVLRLSRGFTTSEADAQDLAQEVFVKAHRALPRLQDPAAFTGWLAMIGRNVGRDAVKKRTRVRAAELPDIQGPSLETQVLRSEARGLAERIIDGMPQGTPKRAARLFYLEDCEVREVADRLETSVTNVTSALSRARAWLRKHLLGELKELRGYR